MKIVLKDIFIKTLLIILAVSFVLFGVINFFSGIGVANIAKVGDKKISTAKFYRYLTEKRNQYASNSSQYDMSFINSRDFVNIALNEFIFETLIQNKIKELYLEEPKQAVLYQLTNDSTFKNKSGDFNMALFKQLLKQNNITEDMYIQYMSVFNSRNALFNMLISNNFANDFILSPLFKRDNMYIVADIITIDQKDIKFTFNTPSNDEIEKYYDENISDFNTKEAKIVSYVEVKLDDDNLENSKIELSNFEDFVATAKSIDDISNKFNVKKHINTYEVDSKDIPSDMPFGFLNSDSGTLSNIVYKDNNVYKIYYIEDVIPSKTLSLNDVKSEILNILKDKARKENDLFILNKIIVQMEKNNIENVAVRNGARLSKNQNIYRDNLTYPDELTQQLFDIYKKNTFTKPVFDDYNNMYYIGYIKAIKQLQPTSDKFTSFEKIKNELNNSYKNSVLKSFENYLFKTGDIILNSNVFNNII